MARGHSLCGNRRFWEIEVRVPVSSGTMLCHEASLRLGLTGFRSPLPVLLLKELGTNEHVGCTGEVCLAAMTVWKSFIVRNHLRMTCSDNPWWLQQISSWWANWTEFLLLFLQSENAGCWRMFTQVRNFIARLKILVSRVRHLLKYYSCSVTWKIILELLPHFLRQVISKHFLGGFEKCSKWRHRCLKEQWFYSMLLLHNYTLVNIFRDYQSFF